MSLNLKINAPKIHNRFDIFKNGEQVAFAENIILDAMWTRLCGGSTYFVNIHYGTGTGALSKTRTSLFTHLGTKTAINVERSYANPTSYWRQSIELGLTDAVGSTITEVGIAFGATASWLVTHAMLRDMNGNPVSIPKTAVDILTIYATVYVTIDNSHATLKMLTPSKNALVKYLLGQFAWASLDTQRIKAGEIGTAENLSGGLFSKPLGEITTYGSWASDTANKRRSVSTPRFNVNDATGHIAEILFYDVARLVLPASGIHAGLDITGAPVGIGNGIAKEFVLPSRNIRSGSVTVKVDGSPASPSLEPAYGTLAMIGVMESTQTLMGLSGSSNGNAIAYVLQGQAGYAYNRKNNGSFYTSTTYRNFSPTYLRNYNNWGISGDGNVVAVILNSTTLIMAVDVWTDTQSFSHQRSNPPGIPNTVDALSLNYDGSLLAVGSAVAPYLQTFDYNGTSWIARSTPANWVDSAVKFCHLSDDGLVLVVGTASSPYVYVFDWVDGAWVRRSAPADLPNAAPIMVRLSGDKQSMVVATGTSPKIFVYDWSGSAWVKRTAELPIAIPSTPTAVGLSYAGDMLMVTTDNSNGTVYLFDWVEGNWISSPSAAGIPTIAKAIYGALLSNASNDIKELYLARYSNGGASGFEIKKRYTKATFTTPPGLITAEAVGTGDATEDEFTLDHTPIAGSLIVKLDGTPTGGYTLAGNIITFTSAPGSGVAITADYRYTCAITADYTVEGIHKTSTRVIDLTFTVQFGEPT